MATRLSLQAKLEASLGSRNVYFQPPETVKLSYPCIIYELNKDRVDYSNDAIYKSKRQYTVMVIDRNPDSEIPDRIRNYPYCTFDRCYTADNLNHFVFTIYY